VKDRIDQIYPLIKDRLIVTDLVHHAELSTKTDTQLYLKLEHQQVTGSFKIRGALSKFKALEDEFASIPEVVAASTGNHAVAVCLAAEYYDCKPTVFVPETITTWKLDKLKATGANIRLEGKHSGESEFLAIQYARKLGLPLVHPYSDLHVMAGQGTIGLEILNQNPQLEVVFVPVGGGGLISGIAGYLKAVNRNIKVIGVQPENASEMADSIKSNSIVPPSKKSTISDGTAGGLDPNALTFEYCKHLVDDFVLVSEQEIIEALRLQEEHAGLVVEPSAALALAGLLKHRYRVSGMNCVVIICGGNILPADFRQIVDNTDI
jgi:threonine dehydratase